MEKWNRLLVFLASVLLLLAFVGVMVRLAMGIHHTLLIFTLGALIAYALSPLVDFVQGIWPLTRTDGTDSGARHIRWRQPGDPPHKGSRGVAIAVVFVGIAFMLGVAVYALGRSFAHEVEVVRDPLQKVAFQHRASVFLAKADAALDHAGLHVDLQSYFTNPTRIPQSVKDAGGAAERKALPLILGIGAAVFESAIVLLIALYFLIYASDMRRLLNDRLPPQLRTHAEVWQEDINRILGGFVRGQLIIALILGITTSLVCLAVGIRLWLLMGAFVTVASLIPVFGAYIGAVPPVIFALIGPDRGAFHGNNLLAAAVVAVLFVVLNEIASKVLYPRLVGQAIGLHEVLVLFVLFAGLEVAGVIGVLLAAPLTAVAIVTVVHLYRFWQELPDTLLAPTLPNRH